MPQFDQSIQYSNRLPGVVQGPRASTNVDTGAGMIGQALSNLGGAINQIGTQYQEANNAIALSKTKRRYDEINAAAYNALDKVTNEEDSKKVLSQYQADVAGLKTGNSWVDQRFDMHVDDTITGVTQQFADKVQKNNIRKLNDEFEVTWKDTLSTGDMDNANKLLDDMVASGSMTQVTAESLSKSFMADSYLQQAENQINLGSPESLKNAEGMIAALSKQDKIKLKAEQLDKMDNLRTNLISSMNRKDAADKQIAREQEFKIFEAMQPDAKQPLTWDMIKAADKVDPTTLKVYWNQYKQGQEETLKGQQSAVKEGDPIARTNLLAQIDLNPEKVTEGYIYSQAGAIGTDHVAYMIDRLNRNLKEKNPIATKYKETLPRVLGSGLMGKKEDVSTYESYVKKVGQMDEYFKLNPGATDQQAQQFFSGLIREDVKKGTLAKIWGFLPYLTPPTAIVQYLLNKREANKISPDGTNSTLESKTPPAEYPDAVWDEQRKMWTIVKDGRLLGVQ